MKKLLRTLSTYLVILSMTVGFFTPVVSHAAISEPVNLSLGKTVTINTPYKHLYDVLGVPFADGGNPSLLTDDKKPSYDNWDTGDWFKFHNGMKREVIVDLGKICTVNKVSFVFGQNQDATITAPFSVRYYVSNDGINYTFIGNAQPDLPRYAVANFTGPQLTKKTYKLDAVGGQPMNIQAQYVKAEFYVDFHAWGDNFNVFGYEGVVNGAVIPQEQPDLDNPEVVNKVPERESLEASEIGDEFLFYTGPYATNPDVTNWTKDKVMPIVGYMDSVGTFSDWQYKNLLVLPVSTVQTPSGAGVFKTTVDCNAFLDFIFKSDTQLGAINEAVRELNDRLNTNQKVKINVAIPMITPTSNFGDIKGDNSTLSLLPEDYASVVANPNTDAGKIEMMSKAIEARINAVKWYVDQVENRFKQAGYDQLELKSYYWYHERLSPGSGEEETIKGVAQYLKSKNRYFTWIPYITQPSAFYWKELGFTSCTLQPMYIAGAKKKEVFPLTYNMAKKTGSSTEIEYTSYATLSKELNFTVMDDVYGMKNSYHNYYYGGANPIVNSAYAFTPLNPLVNVSTTDATMLRSIYDRIYQFTKGIYKPTYTVYQSTNVSNTSNITSSTLLMLADNIVSGEYDIVYDSYKLEFVGFSNGSEIDPSKGSVEAEVYTPGSVRVAFKINDPANALNAEIKVVDQYTNGAPEVAKLIFKKKDGVKDSDISTRLIMAGRYGIMVDKFNNVYENWAETNIMPGSTEEKVVNAREAVRVAEDRYKSVSSTTYSILSACDEAKIVIGKLPEGGYKERFTDRINNIIAKVTMNTPFKIETVNAPSEFKEGNDARVTIRATNNSELFAKDATLIVGLYDQNEKMVNMAVSTVKVKPNETVDLSAVLKVPQGSGSNHKIRCFVWNTLEGMVPYSNSIEIPVVR